MNRRELVKLHDRLCETCWAIECGADVECAERQRLEERAEHEAAVIREGGE